MICKRIPHIVHWTLPDPCTYMCVCVPLISKYCPLQRTMMMLLAINSYIDRATHTRLPHTHMNTLTTHMYTKLIEIKIARPD